MLHSCFHWLLLMVKHTPLTSQFTVKSPTKHILQRREFGQHHPAVRQSLVIQSTPTKHIKSVCLSVVLVWMVLAVTKQSIWLHLLTISMCVCQLRCLSHDLNSNLPGTASPYITLFIFRIGVSHSWMGFLHCKWHQPPQPIFEPKKQFS